jgi:CRP-like cAMP-binding protein
MDSSEVIVFPAAQRPLHRELCHNHLLAALSRPVLRRLAPHLEPTLLALGDVLYEPGQRLTHAYFPTTAVVTLLYATAQGTSAELVGDDGIVGIALFMGGESMPNRAVAQSVGQAFRLEKHALKQEFDRGGWFQNRLLRYTQARLTQVVQTTVCVQYHSVEQQLCRWLLHCLDRLPVDQPWVTRDLIATMMGLSNGLLTEASARLQGSGLISGERDRITVLDRPGLEARACECYLVVSNELRRLAR